MILFNLYYKYLIYNNAALAFVLLLMTRLVPLPDPYRALLITTQNKSDYEVYQSQRRVDVQPHLVCVCV